MTVRTAAVAAILSLAGCAAAACSSPAVPPAALGGVAGSGLAQPSSARPAGPAVSPRAQTVASNPRACAVASSAMVSAALKLPVGRVVGTVEGPVTVCAYTGQYEVIVRFQHGENAVEFADAKQATGANHQLITAVAGLGHGAYLATYTLAKPAVNTLAVRRGRLAIFISSPAPLRAERKLMLHLLARG
jgi:hypothetical protein